MATSFQRFVFLFTNKVTICTVEFLFRALNFLQTTKHPESCSFVSSLLPQESPEFIRCFCFYHYRLRCPRNSGRLRNLTSTIQMIPVTSENDFSDCTFHPHKLLSESATGFVHSSSQIRRCSPKGCNTHTRRKIQLARPPPLRVRICTFEGSNQLLSTSDNIQLHIGTFAAD